MVDALDRMSYESKLKKQKSVNDVDHRWWGGMKRVLDRDHQKELSVSPSTG